MDVNEFESFCELITESIPPSLLDGLNGGILVSDKMPNSDGPPGTVRLGEYIVDPILGRYIVIYYRSFIRLFPTNRTRLVQRLAETILHEVRHHIESRAGINDLTREDMRRLERMWQDYHER